MRRILPTSLQRSTGARAAVATALDSDARSIRGVRAERGAGGTLVVAAAVERASDPADAPLGRDERKSLGLGDEPALIALAREQVLLGEVELPSDDEAEVRSMARLALGRDYAIEGVETAGDFMHVERTDGRSAVLLVSAPRVRIAEAVARAGGGPAARVAVRTLGVLALLRADRGCGAGTVLVVDATAAQCEFTIARDGRLLHARGFALAADSPEARVASILGELRRALAAVRAAEPSLRLSRVLVLADAATASAIVERVEPVAGARGERLSAHPSVALERLAPEARETFRSSCYPLAGLLLEEGGAGRAIDLQHPTPEIDVAARTRQRVLAVAGVMLVAALAGWTFGARSWRELEAQRTDLEAKARNALPELRRTKRDEFLVRHLEVVSAIEPRWMAYLDTIRRFAPDQDVVVFDRIAGQLSDAEVLYTREGAFVARPTLRFDLSGEARDRATADELRAAFVRTRGLTLSSTGADGRGGKRLPAPFDYTLRTAELAPKLGEADGGSPAREQASGTATAQREPTP